MKIKKTRKRYKLSANINKQLNYELKMFFFFAQKKKEEVEVDKRPMGNEQKLCIRVSTIAI